LQRKENEDFIDIIINDEFKDKNTLIKHSLPITESKIRNKTKKSILKEDLYNLDIDILRKNPFYNTNNNNIISQSISLDQTFQTPNELNSSRDYDKNKCLYFENSKVREINFLDKKLMINMSSKTSNYNESKDFNIGSIISEYAENVKVSESKKLSERREKFEN